MQKTPCTLVPQPVAQVQRQWPSPLTAFGTKGIDDDHDHHASSACLSAYLRGPCLGWKHACNLQCKHRCLPEAASITAQMRYALRPGMCLARVSL